MSINFSEVFTAFTTNRYNKSNIIYYAALLLGAVLITALSGNYIVGAAIFIFISILNQGYIIIMSHNESLNSQYVVPDISNLGKIITEGFKYLTGISTLIIIVNLPIILLITIAIAEGIKMAVAGGSSLNTSNIATNISMMFLLLFLFGILSVILTLKYVIPAKLLFIKTLNLSDMFSISKINQFGYLIKNDFWMYVLYFIILSFLINTASQIISQMFTGIFFNSEVLSQINPETVKSINTPDQVFAFFIDFLKTNSGRIIGFTGLSSIIPLILNVLFMPSLNGQTVKSTYPKKTKRKRYEDNIQNYNV